MNRFFAFSCISFLLACGYSAKQNELIGQVKKVAEVTPIICGDYVAADISLGVMRNGVGSMSHEDVDVYVQRDRDIAILKNAVATGKLVRVIYDNKRWPAGLCVPTLWVTDVQILDVDKEKP